MKLKKLKALVVLLAFVSQMAWGMDINPTHTGSWYNPNQDGHGLAVEVLDSETTVIYWYVYDTEGNPIFLLTVATNDGKTASGTTYFYSGMKFGEFNPDDNNEQVWGQASLTTDACDSAMFEYSSIDPAFGSGTIHMVKLASVEGVKCVSEPLQGNYMVTLVTPDDVAIGNMWVTGNRSVTFAVAAPGGITTAFGVANVEEGANEVDGNLWVFDMTLYTAEGDSTNEVATGTINSDEFIKIEFEGGVLSGYKIRMGEKAADYAQISRTYDIVDFATHTSVGNMTLMLDGKVNVSMSDGCSMSGDYFWGDIKFNQITYRLLASDNCQYNPDIFGTGHMGVDQMTIALNDGEHGMIWILEP
jgi:hypothetical protein